MKKITLINGTSFEADNSIADKIGSVINGEVEITHIDKKSGRVVSFRKKEVQSITSFKWPIFSRIRFPYFLLDLITICIALKSMRIEILSVSIPIKNGNEIIKWNLFYMMINVWVKNTLEFRFILFGIHFNFRIKI